jgi:5-methylcytosine-specific restriction endonuclease McrA
MEKGKTYEEVYGVEKAKIIKDKLSKAKSGQTYEQIHGEEKGKELRIRKANSTSKSWQDPEVRKARCIGISKSMQGKGYKNGAHGFRKRALEHYGCKCQKCGYDKYVSVLDVHHKDYDRTNNELDNLEVLCVRCHIEKHIEDGRRFGTRTMENKTEFGIYEYNEKEGNKCLLR